MALLVGAVMAIIMLGFMWGMYKIADLESKPAPADAKDPPPRPAKQTR